MIIIDTNVWIFSESINAPEHRLAINKYRESITKGKIAINSIIVSELYHQLSRLFGRADAASKINEIVRGTYTEFLALDAETTLRAVKMARDFQMRINDALIAQQAIEMDATVLTDNIKDFGKIKSLKVMPLRS